MTKNEQLAREDDDAEILHGGLSNGKQTKSDLDSSKFGLGGKTKLSNDTDAREVEL